MLIWTLCPNKKGLKLTQQKGVKVDPIKGGNKWPNKKGLKVDPTKRGKSSFSIVLLDQFSPIWFLPLFIGSILKVKLDFFDETMKWLD